MIRKTGKSEWTVFAESGKRMGSYPSHAQAAERLRQVEAAKAAKGAKGPGDESEDSRKTRKLDPTLSLARLRLAGPRGGIEAAVPPTEQQTSYTCGPAALAAVAQAFDVGAPDEDQLSQLAGTTENGTTPEGLAAAAKQLGLSATVLEHLAPEDLFGYLAQGRLAIIALQAWADEEPSDGYANSWQHGHYVVFTGVSEDGRLLFEDPSLDEIGRASLTGEDLIDRWHDTDGGRDRMGLAIIVSGPAPLPKQKPPSDTPMP